jgi:predicted ATP-grasp superfamily ATP-dependent carboligase
MACQHSVQFIITDRFYIFINGEISVPVFGVSQIAAQAVGTSMLNPVTAQQECIQFDPPLLAADQ